MSDVPFHQTVMGRRFLESTIPKLVEEIAKLNATVAELVKAIEKTAPSAKASEDERL